MYAGTAILLKPGVIAGGPVVHDCPLSRSIGYFLEPVIMLAPFSKKPLNLTLRGVTSDDRDLSVSMCLFPLGTGLTYLPRWTSYVPSHCPTYNFSASRTDLS